MSASTQRRVADLALPPGVEVVHYANLTGTPCPCGSAKRGFMESAGIPFSLHITSISENAKLHYHKRLTETYLILECEPDAVMQVNDCRIPLAPEMAILIPPGTRHRAIGKMKVAIVAWPKFDPSDEWFDIRVLDVGNCGYDHGKISQMLKREFDAEVVLADSASETLERLARESFDLVLVNRKLDHDYSDGLEVIKLIKRHPEFSSLPVMMITNYPEHQEQSVAAGALYGFGKLELAKPETLQRLSAVLKPAS